jgi:two-component system sensor histidine kinase KdpD
MLGTAAVTAVTYPLRDHFHPASVIMLFLLHVALVSRFLQRGSAVLASILSVAAFDFFFIKPHLTFAVEDVQYVVTFAVMLIVGLVISGLTGQLEAQVTARAATQSQIANEQLRNSLLSSISHDLRTPLAGISGAASTLLSLPPAAAAASAPQLLETIRDESDRLALLVTNILEMTRLESGAVQLKREWLPLEEPIGAALNALEPQLAGRRVIVELPRDLPLVWADPVLLERLIANLLDNAIRHTPNGTEVTVSAQALPYVIRVVVADRGPGLGGADQATLFSKFAVNSGAATSSGGGLGLSICAAIVAAHGGTIVGRPRPGGGAEFVFELPQLADQPVVIPEEPAVGEAR